MASSLPTVSDCCSMCSGQSVDITTVSVRQVYDGNGDPNTNGTEPDDPTIANVYYNLDVPGELWNWSIENENWF